MLLTTKENTCLAISIMTTLDIFIIVLSQYCISQNRYRWIWFNFSSVQFSHSVMSDSLQPHEPQHVRPPCPSPTPRSPPKPTPIESMMPSNHLILCRPLLLLPSIFPRIRVFSNESALCIRWPKYWSFGFKISPTNEHPGLISFRMD